MSSLTKILGSQGTLATTSRHLGRDASLLGHIQYHPYSQLPSTTSFLPMLLPFFQAPRSENLESSFSSFEISPGFCLSYSSLIPAYHDPALMPGFLPKPPRSPLPPVYPTLTHLHKTAFLPSHLTEAGHHLLSGVQILSMELTPPQRRLRPRGTSSCTGQNWEDTPDPSLLVEEKVKKLRVSLPEEGK